MQFMNASKITRYIVMVSLLILLIPVLSVAKTSPVLNDGKKWRIGYYEGGPYADYTETMRTLILGLMKLGWIKTAELPAIAPDSPKAYWKWLTKFGGKYLFFHDKNFYSVDWKEKKRQLHKDEILAKLKNGKLDLMIAMGSWAGQDLANQKHHIPTIVLSTSDPVKAGIIKSEDDSGFDHVTARVDKDRYLRQARMFHRIARFSTLGVAIEDGPLGDIYSAMDELKQAAAERGFKLISCRVSETKAESLEAADKSCLNCYRYLAQKADAVYVTALTCVDRNISPIVALFRSQQVPSFSMTGSKHVAKGLLLSISSDSGYEAQGIYNAQKIAAILNGAKPRSLNQGFADPLEIAVNIETANIIKFKMPKSILNIAREIYAK